MNVLFSTERNYAEGEDLLLNTRIGDFCLGCEMWGELLWKRRILGDGIFSHSPGPFQQSNLTNEKAMATGYPEENRDWEHSEDTGKNASCSLLTLTWVRPCELFSTH